MQIFNANESHIEYISQSLAQHFSHANEFFEYSKYKDQYKTMLKHVSRRISGEDSDFLYLVAEEEGKPVGFINFQLTEENIGSILILMGDNSKVIKSLIEDAVRDLKEKGADKIEGEVFVFEKEVLEVLKELGMKEQLINFKL